MAISNLPILSMLRTRMHWHQERQRLLAENVANAETPRFKPRDLAPPNVGRPVAAGSGPLVLAATTAAHIQPGSSGNGQFQAERKASYEVRPSGSAVNLEDEMLKVAANQMDYQAATALYGRSLGLIKAALGKR
jgi:flagellar basal-body rod protein FlgB